MCLFSLKSSQLPEHMEGLFLKQVVVNLVLMKQPYFLKKEFIPVWTLGTDCRVWMFPGPVNVQDCDRFLREDRCNATKLAACFLMSSHTVRASPEVGPCRIPLICWLQFLIFLSTISLKNSSLSCATLKYSFKKRHQKKIKHE